MYVDKIQFNQLKGAPRMSVNAAHIEIRVGNRVVFLRDHSSSDVRWYDEDHQALIKALDAVELVVDRICQKEE